MVSSILISLDSLLDLALEPGWNGDYEDFDHRREELDRLQALIEADRLIVYAPPFLVSIAHMQVKIHFGAEQAQRVVRKILELSSSHLSIDYERLLEQSNTAHHYPDRADLYDVMLLVCGNQLSVDAILTRDPTFFHQLIEANKTTFAGYSIPILSIGAFLNLVSETQSTYPLREETIYAVTPQNNVIKLPRGATPIDFAYKIHTRLGDRCIKARVNGQEVPLDRSLKTGDVVEILKHPSAAPDSEWLSFVVTRTAKQGIQRGLKRMNTQRGWVLLQQAFGKALQGYRPKLDQVAQFLNRTSVDDLVSGVGSGEISIQRLQELVQNCTYPVAESSLPVSANTRTGTGQNCRIALCCMPLPGDAIIGVVGSAKRLVRVHRADCARAQNITPEKLHSLHWNCDRCHIQLQIVLPDQPDTFRPILNKLVEHAITPDLRRLNIAGGTAKATIGITITSRSHLDAVLWQISNLPNVLQVKPVKPIEIGAGSVEWGHDCSGL